MKVSATRVYRTKIIEGLSVPAVIHNGSYFFTDLDIYEDGRVEYWEIEDFEHFKQKMREGWIVTVIPDGSSISIHGLGSWPVTAGSWLFNKKSFVSHAESLIRTLNPRMENIYTYRKKTLNGIGFVESGKGTVYKENKRGPYDLFPEKINGNSENLFYQTTDGYYLVRLVLYPDHTVCLERLETPIQLSMQEFESLVSQGILLSEIPLHAKVHIYGLGSFVAGEADYSVDIDDKLAEIRDTLRQMSGAPSSIALCKQAYEAYIADPTAANKTLLQQHYEAVPEHQRMYVGDMDTKDTAVRMIIYGEDEIKGWSHYQLALHQGLPLPSIDIPTMKKDDEV
ncbi:DUF7638 domain-containing protein [Chitinophaga flava]|uniref:Uncharacterized protein n=1 Tax=Chitinophaga flava TaxID=2259036 RepID=A0A365XWF8_9BACT|nr:hypothetical protein [Chitinophaga flava]RBL90687.1 hypothetical protein DF182_30025 [Chitinophaga flava]